MRTWSFAKGQGTGNDFVILTDRNNWLQVSAADVQWLCDRRFGIGGDGLLRAVKAAHIPEWKGDPDLWFMDYRNADGSIAEMCGNGLRVFGRHLMEAGLASGSSIEVATRAGLRRVEQVGQGNLRATLGVAVVGDTDVQVTVGGQSWPATHVDVGNPHAVVFLSDEEDLGAIDLSQQPTVTPWEAYPHGVNVEFAQVVGPSHVRMRVHERGSGETLSCGTGVGAVATTYLSPQTSGEVRVEVPGGTLVAEVSQAGISLVGPAVVVARGEVNLPDQ